jgi:hypothetical protein
MKKFNQKKNASLISKESIQPKAKKLDLTKVMGGAISSTHAAIKCDNGPAQPGA